MALNTGTQFQHIPYKGFCITSAMVETNIQINVL